MRCLRWQIYAEEVHRSLCFCIFGRVLHRRWSKVGMGLRQPV